MLKTVVEAPLVLRSSGDDHVGVSGQQLVHARLVPDPARRHPPVIVRVDREVASLTKFIKDAGLPYPGHPRHENSSHDVDGSGAPTEHELSQGRWFA
jgi:hypothetical protein